MFNKIKVIKAKKQLMSFIQLIHIWNHKKRILSITIANYLTEGSMYLFKQLSNFLISKTLSTGKQNK